MTLGRYPTPVERIDALSHEDSALWVKRDDLTHPLYGGNKVRKLERILEEAKRRGKKRILTVGAAGSHHVLATTLFAREAGLDVTAILVPQPRTEHVVMNLRSGLGHALVAYPSGSYAAAGLALALRMRPDVQYVPVGGSNALGALGYVDAVTELAAQVKRGEMPEPDVIVVTLGSGGTAAGIAMGLEKEGMRSRLVAVCVSKPIFAVAWMARRLAGAAGKRIEVERRYLGAGYGHPTPWGDRAAAVAERVSLHVDSTYTAKTFAAALDLVAGRRGKTILYWHTLSSAPMEPLLEGAPADVPQALVRLLR